jgi:hypothetical protein
VPAYESEGAENPLVLCRALPHKAGVIAILGQIYNIYVLPPKKQISPDLFNYTIAGLLILGIIFTVWGKLKGG